MESSAALKSCGISFIEAKERLAAAGIFGETEGLFSFKLSPEPFWITPAEHAMFEELGQHLFAFYKAANRLYLQSRKGILPAWIHEYLDAGKPDTLLKLCRMNRTKSQLPAIIRPDVILREGGYTIAELDSIPGGFGTVACLNMIYSTHFNCVGGIDGIPKAFYHIFQSLTGKDNPEIAIVISKESSDYRPEMAFLASFSGIDEIHLAAPEDILFREEGLFLPLDNGKEIKLDAIYRFFELFDLDNIPKSELLTYSVKKNKVKISPPYKPFLEEKLLFALFYHPILRDFWEKELGKAGDNLLRAYFPASWIIDSRPLPPYAVIPDLTIGKQAVPGWKSLKQMTKQERQMIIKISGFSPLAWGSRGVYAGHDMPEKEWSEIVDKALESFPEHPYILQQFFKAKRVEVKMFDDAGRITTTAGRVRLSPYYFSDGEKVTLSAILATICPLDKVLIHGMTQSIMAPCAIKNH